MLTDHPAPRPTIEPIFDVPDPRLHWFGVPDHDGAPWTPDTALGATIREGTVHWTEEHAPSGRPARYYRQMLGHEAYYHAFIRDWNLETPGIQQGDGLMYHYAITPPDDAGKVHIYQTTPETKRTWNAFAANDWNLAVVLMAGHGDVVQQATVTALKALLAWWTTGRADLPYLTTHPMLLLAPNRTPTHTNVQTYGVLTHDESLIRQGREPKGCCGIYAPIVQAWRARQPSNPPRLIPKP